MTEVDILYLQIEALKKELTRKQVIIDELRLLLDTYQQKHGIL